MSVENPMVLGDDGVPFDDFYVTCCNCGKEFAPTEMDEDLEDVCCNCVAECIKDAKLEVEYAFTPDYYTLFNRILESYTDGAL